MSLSPKHQQFVAEYLVDMNATEAAIRSGYSRKTARAQGCRLLTDVDIQAAVKAGQSAKLTKTGVTAERVMLELQRLAFSDLRQLFTPEGELKPMRDLTDDQAATVASLEVLKKNVAAGDGHIDTIHKLKVWDKLKALEMLSKHFGLLIERVDHSGKIEIAWLTE